MSAAPSAGYARSPRPDMIWPPGCGSVASLLLGTLPTGPGSLLPARQNGTTLMTPAPEPEGAAPAEPLRAPARVIGRRGLGRLALGGAAAVAVSGALVPHPAEASSGLRIFGWGSSSLASAKADESGHCRVLESVGTSLDRTVHNFARSGQTSYHSMAMRGFYAPQLRFVHDEIPASTRPVEVHLPALFRHPSMTYAGTVLGVSGVLESFRDGTATFRRDAEGAPVRAPGGAGFVSALPVDASENIHVYWMGKNDLCRRGCSKESALSNQERAAAMPSTTDGQRIAILGMWKTYRDPPRALAAVDWLNRSFVNAFGTDRILDVQTLLTTAWGLDSPPVTSMRILDDPQWREQARQGLPPRCLVAGDRMHLNARGNAVVAWALRRHLRTMGW